MHSGVFAISPMAAARVVSGLAHGRVSQPGAEKFETM